MVKYDPHVLHELAEKIYHEADKIVVAYVLLGVFISLPIIYVLTIFLNLISGILVASFIVLICYLIARDKVLRQKAEAQVLLWRVEVESHLSKKK